MIIKIEKINRQEAFRYMGINGEPDMHTISAADECEQLLLKSAAPKWNWVFAEISGTDTEGIALSGHKLVLRGKDIAGHLNGCFGVILLCATLGTGTDKLLRTLQTEDMAKALIADSMASAAIEQVCDIAEEEIRQRFPDKFMTWRFSPGYGDFPLETQRDFLSAVNASRTVGVFLTEGGLLAPTKSVTAVIGISDKPINAMRRGCGSCTLRESCTFRQTGGHCGE